MDRANVRTAALEQGVEPVVPPKKNRRNPWEYAKLLVGSLTFLTLTRISFSEAVFRTTFYARKDSLLFRFFHLVEYLSMGLTSCSFSIFIE